MLKANGGWVGIVKAIGGCVGIRTATGLVGTTSVGTFTGATITGTLTAGVLEVGATFTLAGGATSDDGTCKIGATTVELPTTGTVVPIPEGKVTPTVAGNE